jgi:hypothetical protein
MNDVPLHELASASASAYDQSSPQNYERVSDLSSPDISTYRRDNAFIVAHRGTDFKKATDITKHLTRKQLKADSAILFGNRAQNELHKKRTKETERIVASIKSQHPDSTIHVTGHSLGGSTAMHSLIKSKVVRDNVDALHTFNAGSSPFQQKGMSPTNKAYKTIEAKSTHHSIQGDEISRSIGDSLIGKKVVYSPGKKKHTITTTVLDLASRYLKTHNNPLSKLAHFAVGKLSNTLSAHSLDNFTTDKRLV